MQKFRKLKVKFENCTGCKICQLICAITHEKVANPKKARIRLIPKNPDSSVYSLKTPTFCVQCDDPLCVRSCPNNALVKETDGTIRLVEEKCNACRICMDFCHIGAIFSNPDTQKPLICDLCDGNPSCVRWCPGYMEKKALEYE